MSAEIVNAASDSETQTKPCDLKCLMSNRGVPHRIPEGMTKAEAMARMHNGGPAALRATGKKKENLDRYWSKVQKALKELTR